LILGVHIPGSKQFNVNELEIKNREFSIDKLIIVYCETGDKSYKIAKALRNDGYKSFSLEGGWSNGWEPFIKESSNTS